MTTPGHDRRRFFIAKFSLFLSSCVVWTYSTFFNRPKEQRAGAGRSTVVVIN